MGIAKFMLCGGYVVGGRVGLGERALDGGWEHARAFRRRHESRVNAEMLQKKGNARLAPCWIWCWPAIAGGQCAALKVDGQQKSLLGAKDRDASSEL